MTTVVIYPQGNKREVPPDVPIGAWLEEMRHVAAHPDLEALLTELPWAHPVMEYLEPELLMRFRIQALVWHQYTGEFPGEVAYWWPVRLGRRRGQVPSLPWAAKARIDASGVLHCGFCGARWSANSDGTSHPDRCKLCDRLSIVVSDERRILHGNGVTA